MLSSSWSEQMNAITYVRRAADVSVSLIVLVTRGTIIAVHLDSLSFHSVNVNEISSGVVERASLL
jgi:hypothetical protein